MAVQFQEIGVSADLTVQVPRDAAGDLDAGVRRALARIDAVHAIEAVEVRGLTPRLNDLQAEVTAELTLALDRPEPEAARKALDDGFGVSTDGVALVEPPP